MTIPSWAKPGVKVIFLGAPKDRALNWFGISAPQVGGEYTIRTVFLSKECGACIYLQEIKNPAVPTSEGIMERGYNLPLFRPVEHKSLEEDVALFTHLLDGLPVRERAQ